MFTNSVACTYDLDKGPPPSQRHVGEERILSEKKQRPFCKRILHRLQEQREGKEVEPGGSGGDGHSFCFFLAAVSKLFLWPSSHPTVCSSYMMLSFTTGLPR